MPSQEQVRWSQLRVGITVIIAAAVLAVLIFLMSGTSGLFSHKIVLKAYFNNAGGLRVGAPVRLQGVDIGNVKEIVVVENRKDDPVEVTFKVSTQFKSLRKDSKATLATAGVLGETFVDIDSKDAHERQAQEGDVLAALDKPDIQDVVRSSAGTLQQMQALLQRVDRIVATIERGDGSIGKLINDPALFNKLNKTLSEAQALVEGVTSGKGSIGKLLVDDELYRKVNGSVDKVNKMLDDVQAGKGSAGMFLKDPALYKNANETIGKANKLMDDVNAGKGALGKFAKDEEFARKLDNTMSRISLLATRLEQGEGSAGMLFKDPSLYNNADQMLVETRNLVKAVRENPKKYLTIHFKVF